MIGGFSLGKVTGLIACLAVTAQLTVFVHHYDLRKYEKNFEVRGNEIRNEILDRLKADEQSLDAASAFIGASDTVTLSEWNRFIQGVNILGNLAGIYNINFVPGAGNNDTFKHGSIIISGHDLSGEPAAREAMFQARDSAKPVITDRITFQSAGDDMLTGVMMIVPVYKNESPGEDLSQRRDNLKAWVYSFYKVDDLFPGMSGKVGNNLKINLEVYYGSISDTTLLYAGKGRKYKSPHYVAEHPIDFYDSKLIVRTSSHKTCISFWIKEILIVGGGIIIVILLFSLHFSFIKIIRNAHQLADELHRDLRESEQKYRLMAENISDVIWIFNINLMKFTYISPSVAGLRGITSEEAVNQSLEESFTPESVLKIMNLIPERLKEFTDTPEKIKPYYTELYQNCRNGEIVCTEAMTHFQFSPEGEIEIFGVSRNISERKKNEQKLIESEKQLRQINATKDRLFSIIAHDLRSPFNSVLGFTEIISDCLRNNEIEKASRFVKIVNSSAGQTLVLLENLLNWARNQTGSIDFKPGKYKLYPVVQEIIEVQKTSAEVKKIELKNEIASYELQVTADLNMLETILRNLVSNAIKFTNPGGIVEIYAEKRNGNVEICVSDNGIGIDTDTLREICSSNAFQTKNGTLNEKGSGLGLLLCREFIGKHEGNLRIESAPEQGSKFIFSLPDSISTDY